MWGIPAMSGGAEPVSWSTEYGWKVTAYCDRDGVRWNHIVRQDGAQFWERVSAATADMEITVPRAFTTLEELDRQRGPLTAVGADDIAAVLRSINRLTYERDTAKRDLYIARSENAWLVAHAPEPLAKAYRDMRAETAHTADIPVRKVIGYGTP